MAVFRVGQRVRVNCSESRSHGEQTTILSLDKRGMAHGIGFFIGVEVAIPCAREGWPFCVFEYHELEPIIDDGRTVITWDACCWKPPVTEVVT